MLLSRPVAWVYFGSGRDATGFDRRVERSNALRRSLRRSNVLSLR